MFGRYDISPPASTDSLISYMAGIALRAMKSKMRVRYSLANGSVKRITDHSLQHAGNRWHLVNIRARSGDDHHRSRGAGAQFDVLWNFLDAHHYRYTLRESDPLEGGLDGGQLLEACAAVLL